MGKGDTRWFVHDRFGMFIHWGLYSLPARHEWVRHAERIPNEAYEIYFEMFNPDLFDPKAWAKAAREAGMKYFVITTKHHEGFCLWDTKYTDYKVTNTPVGRDLLREIVDAFRGEGLKVGFYYSLLDWHHPDFTIDRIHPLRDLPPEEIAKLNSTRDMKRYAQYMRDQVTELLTNYGKVDIIMSLEPMEALRYVQELSKDGWIVTSSVPFVNIPNYPEKEEIYAHLRKLPHTVMLDVEALAKDAGAPAQAANMVLLGAAIPMMDLSYEAVRDAVAKVFSRKGQDVVDKNIAALEAGYRHSVSR